MTYPSWSTGELLSSSDMNRVGLWRITRATLGAAGPSLSVNNCFTSSFASYRLVITNATHATTAVNLLLRLRAAGTDKGVSGYYYSRQYIAMGGGSGGFAGASNSAEIQPGIVATTTNPGSGVIDIHDPQLARITACTYQGIWAVTTGETSQGSGFLNDTVSYDGFSLLANTGNLASLTVTVYGYNNLT